LNDEKGAARIDVERLVEMLRRGVGERDHFHDRRIGDDNIQIAFFRLHGLIQSVKIVEIGYIALYRRHVPADLRLFLIELGLPS
jgi:hypothetical protein